MFDGLIEIGPAGWFVLGAVIIVGYIFAKWMDLL